MRAFEERVRTPRPASGAGLIEQCARELGRLLPAGLVPMRFVVAATEGDELLCELAVLEGGGRATGQLDVGIRTLIQHPVLEDLACRAHRRRRREVRVRTHRE